ncbi:MAG TPA: sigma 54-interacting transcriptional regulator [Thermoanaerobaculaceae bacterium]|nr:sigma 54-interacting transcriptional regulator [Thermoanaerobaculaceae bacterium]HPS78994.1 sigma 54-interacting transcriptional regulator [Thermoanaerobaculaceae bacterium]
MVMLSLESENGAVLTYRLSKAQITVGSSSRNDVVVKSPGVADRHLSIGRSADVFTFVTVDRQTVVLNGERRSRGVLNPGDRLRIGGATLVFRGGDGAGMEAVEEAAAKPAAPRATPRDAGEGFSLRSDPAGFVDYRRRLVEIFRDPRFESLQQAIAVVREALPNLELAVLEVTPGGEMVALTSVWTGELPGVGPDRLEELRTTGRFGVLSDARGGIVVVPIVDEQATVQALLAARPAGGLGDEGLLWLGELGRLLTVCWRRLGRPGAPGAGWESEAAGRLEGLLPGSSQAMQVLRAGVLAAAFGNEPVLICGAPGVGKTEVARILTRLGSTAGRTMEVVECRGMEADGLRKELFGSTGHPTFGPEARGAVGRCRGGVLVLRHADAVSPALQSELASVIAAQQRESMTAFSLRWVITCGEDPLALVQQGKLAMPFFMVFSGRMLRVPRLAERREDLPRLIATLIRSVAASQQKDVRGVSLECLNTLLAQTFNGEMAELVLEIGRLVTATPDGEMVRSEHFLGRGVRPDEGEPEGPADSSEVLSSDDLKQVVERVERLLIDRVMKRVKGNQSKGARTLNISRGALIAKLKEYQVPDYRFLRRRRK